MMPYFVYILRTNKNTLYTGQTNNIERRLKKHFEKKAAKYTRAFPIESLVYTEEFTTVGDALRREREIKSWTKKKKEALIQNTLVYESGEK